LRADSLHIISWRGARAVTDRTQRVVIQAADSTVVAMKWATAPRGGGTFNKEPRYEAAAYALQRLFLGDSEYVVPPTILRVFPLEFVRAHDDTMQPTFDDAASVLVALQYWLPLVSPENVWDSKRAETDTVYARHVGNKNVLTYLIRHSDSNTGNFLISTVPNDPRVYSVDNGVAFRSEASNRGFAWRDLRVKRLPAATVERLRAITPADLERALATLIEMERRDGRLQEVEPGPNVDPSRGIRRDGDRIQLGLSFGEIRDIEGRLSSLLRRVDRGQIQVF
jgi:hypothetical protein